MDLDTTTRKGSHDRILRTFGDGGADILLGTQMIAKGLDFPNVTLVGVVSADTQMLLPDFRSAERTFQLLTQVAGAGREKHVTGEVIIQTHQPEHYSLRHVVDHNYRSFFEEELQSRVELSYPPMSRLLLIEVRGATEESVQKAAEKLGALLKRSEGSFIILGPSPAAIAKIASQYRWHILLKSLKDRDPGGSLAREAVRRVLAEYGPPQAATRRFWSMWTLSA